MTATDNTNLRQFYHGTRADLKPGDLIAPGYSSNYGKQKQASWVYLTGTLDAAVWGAELAVGDGPGRIYIVEPTGPIEGDPNLTDKKFPGNEARSHAGGMASTAVTQSYRSRAPLGRDRGLAGALPRAAQGHEGPLRTIEAAWHRGDRLIPSVHRFESGHATTCHHREPK